MSFFQITGRIESFTEVLQPTYSQIDDLMVMNADGRKTAISRAYLRNDMLQFLQQAQADGSEVELFIDRRPRFMGRHQLFGLKAEHVALFDRCDPALLWNAIPTVMVMIAGWLISIQYFYAHFDLMGFLFAGILVQVGMLIGSMHQCVPLSIARFLWLLANRLDRGKLFYGDSAEARRTKALEPASN
jgi:hypothetical protein